MFNALAFNCDYKDAIGEIKGQKRSFLIFILFVQGRLMRPLTGARLAPADKLLLSNFPQLCLRLVYH